MHPHRIAGLLVCSLLAPACGGESNGNPTSEYLIEDSTGIRIVTYAAPLESLDLPLVHLDTVVVIGTAAGQPSHEFARIVSALIEGDRVLVADGSSSEIRAFDLDGRHIRTVGGQGAGPGEFESLRWITASAQGTIYAWDSSLSRLSVFDAGLGFIRSVVPAFTRSATAMVLGLVDDSTLLASVLPVPSRSAAVNQVRIGSVNVSTVSLAESAIPETLTEPSGRPVYFREDGRFLAVPLTVLPGYGAGASRVYAGNGSDAEIAGFGSDGDLELIVRLPSPSPIDPTMWSEAREAYLADSPAEDHQARAGLFDAIPQPDSVPSFAGLRVARSGELWVGVFETGNTETRTWTIMSDAGIAQARLELPVNVQVLDVTGTRLVGVARDDLGVERIIVVEYGGGNGAAG
jgi:hypothetical protein